MSEIDLSIIIVTWNTSAYIQPCVDALLNSKGVRFQDQPLSLNGSYQAEIIVVDSASSDNTPQILAQMEHITFLPQSQNLGFASCNNIGAKHSRGRYLLLLNPDTKVFSETLEEMLNFYTKHPQTGALGPHLINTDGSTQMMPRVFPTIIGTIFELPYLELVMPWQLFDAENIYSPPPGTHLDVDWVLGCALLSPRNLYQSLGGMNEGYRMYAEDKDYCYKVKQLGHPIYVLTTTRLIHHGSKSSAQRPIVLHREYWLSNLRYFYKYRAYPIALFLHLVILIWYISLYMIISAKRLIQVQQQTDTKPQRLSNSVRYQLDPKIMRQTCTALVVYLFQAYKPIH